MIVKKIYNKWIKLFKDSKKIKYYENLQTF